MTTYIALYRGPDINNAKMVAVSCDPQLVAQVAAQLLTDPHYADNPGSDPVLDALNRGRRRALRLIQEERQ
jgi:hypothetical protein